jgi:hypothetical protein
MRSAIVKLGPQREPPDPDRLREKTGTPRRKPYDKPEIVRWGTMRELTMGPLIGLQSDMDFSGSLGV